MPRLCIRQNWIIQLLLMQEAELNWLYTHFIDYFISTCVAALERLLSDQWVNQVAWLLQKKKNYFKCHSYKYLIITYFVFHYIFYFDLLLTLSYSIFCGFLKNVHFPCNSSFLEDHQNITISDAAVFITHLPQGIKWSWDNASFFLKAYIFHRSGSCFLLTLSHDQTSPLFIPFIPQCIRFETIQTWYEWVPHRNLATQWLNNAYCY